MKPLPLILTLLATPAMAQSVATCEGRFEAQITSVAEPLEDNTRSFANGAIRLTIMDTAEPACCSFHLAVVLPDDQGFAACELVSRSDGYAGFSGLEFAPDGAAYDAETGLRVRLLTWSFDGDTTSPGPDLIVGINQQTGSVTAAFVP